MNCVPGFDPPALPPALPDASRSSLKSSTSAYRSIPSTPLVSPISISLCLTLSKLSGCHTVRLSLSEPVTSLRHTTGTHFSTLFTSHFHFGSCFNALGEILHANKSARKSMEIFCSSCHVNVSNCIKISVSIIFQYLI